MEFNLENFEEQCEQLDINEYFQLQDDIGGGVVVGRVLNISDMFVIGYWNAAETVSVFDYNAIYVDELYEFILEKYIDFDVERISEIEHF